MRAGRDLLRCRGEGEKERDERHKRTQGGNVERSETLAAWGVKGGFPPKWARA